MTMSHREPKLLLCRSFPKTHSLRAFLIGERQEVGGQAAGCVWQTSLQIAQSGIGGAIYCYDGPGPNPRPFDALQVERS